MPAWGGGEKGVNWISSRSSMTVREVVYMKFVLFAVLLLFPSFLFSQGRSGLDFKQLSVNEGLSHSDITSLAQDASGFLWLGTHNGLNRYDGNTVRVFKNNAADSFSLPDNRVNKILPDSMGKIWIGTERNGLALFDQTMERFIRVKTGNGSLWITDIQKDRQGLVWVGTKRNGLWCVRLNSHGEPEIIRKEPGSITSDSTDFQINALLPDDDKRILIASDKGLLVYHKGSRTIEKLPLTREIPVHRLMKDQSGIIWVGGWNGLYRLEGWGSGGLKQPALVEVPETKGLKTIETLYQDKKGTIWIGTQKDGAFRLLPPSSPMNNAGSWKMEPVSRNIRHSDFTGSFINIKCFTEDKFGLIWMGTAGGGAIYSNLKNRLFHAFSLRSEENQFLEDTYVTAVFSERDWLWAGSRKGLCLYETATGKAHIYFKNLSITCIYKDAADVYWVGTTNAGLIRMQGKPGGSFNIDYFTNHTGMPNELIGNSISSIAEDRFQRLWVGTFNKGVNLMSANRDTVVKLRKNGKTVPLNSDIISSIYADPAHPAVWISYKDAGVDRIDYTEQTSHSTNFRNDPANSQSLSGNFAWPVRRTNDSTIWIGTIGAGLNKITELPGNKVRFRHYTTEQGLKDNDIEAIETDEDGNLWLAGYGISRLNPRNGHIAFFDYADGLQSNAFKVGASFRDAFGMLYFGGINGMNYFDPASIEVNNIPPDIVLSGLSVFNQRIGINEKHAGNVPLHAALNYTDTIRLNADQNDFTIAFTGIHLADPKKLSYRYKLNGYNTDWVEASGNAATFANLPAGTYTFEVYALSRNNNRSAATKTLTVVLLPHWWATWWAYTAYALLLLIAVSVIWKVNKKQYMLRQELMLAEKQKELDQGKLEFFTNISHELRTPISLIYGPVTDFLDKGMNLPNAKEKLWLMYRNAKRLLTLTNQLLDFRKMETGNMKLAASETDMGRFVKEIFLVFRNKAEEAGIDYRFTAPPERFKLFIDTDKMELVFTNLLSNAFKYTSPKGSVTVQINTVGKPGTPARFERHAQGLRPVDHYMEITVEDDGIGIPADQIDLIFNSYYQASRANSLITTGTGLGLSIAKGIVNRHQGSITVENRKEKGTRFVVRLPFGKAHLHPDEITEKKKLPVEDLIGTEPILFSEEVIADMEEEEIPVSPEISIPAGLSIHPTRYQVLIVEDNEDVLQYLKRDLESEFRVLLARNGKEGLEKAKSYIPDIIISDVMMPEMDGLEMCRRLKSDPDVNYIPIVLLTARSASVYEIEGIETGADDYITKPFNFRLLKAKIHNFLSARQKIKDYYRKLIAMESVQPEVNNADELFLNKMIELVEENLSQENFNVKKLSQEMAMSQSALYKRIKNITGGTAIDFVRSVRFRKAASLLAGGNLPVNDVAQQIGISDMKYFREQFRKYYGVAPSEYSRNSGSGNGGKTITGLSGL